MGKSIRAQKYEGEKAFAVAAKVPCPESQGRWNPRPHGEVLQMLLEVSELMNLQPNIDKLRVTFTHAEHARMFGTFPVEAFNRDQHGYTVGFANSLDKSISLRIFFGTEVFICSNGMMIGEYSERRLHTTNLSVAETVKMVMERSGTVVEMEDVRLSAIQKFPVQNPDRLFFEAVQAGALAKSHVVDAWVDYNAALDRDKEALIEVPGSMWAFQNAVTAQWKKTRNDESTINRSFALKRLMEGVSQNTLTA